MTLTRTRGMKIDFAKLIQPDIPRAEIAQGSEAKYHSLLETI